MQIGRKYSTNLSLEAEYLGCIDGQEYFSLTQKTAGREQRFLVAETKQVQSVIRSLILFNQSSLKIGTLRKFGEKDRNNISELAKNLGTIVQ